MPSVSISYGAFGSLRLMSRELARRGHEVFQSPTEHSVHCDILRYCVGIARIRFQSPTEHSVHCDSMRCLFSRWRMYVSISYGAFGSLRLKGVGRLHEEIWSFNLLRSIRFIATQQSMLLPSLPKEVSISYGAFGSLRPQYARKCAREQPSFNLLRSIRFIATQIREYHYRITYERFNLLRSIRFIATIDILAALGTAYEFQSPTEHSVHCDAVRLFCLIIPSGFNLLRSIRFIATSWGVNHHG